MARVRDGSEQVDTWYRLFPINEGVSPSFFLMRARRPHSQDPAPRDNIFPPQKKVSTCFSREVNHPQSGQFHAWQCEYVDELQSSLPKVEYLLQNNLSCKMIKSFTNVFLSQVSVIS